MIILPNGPISFKTGDLLSPSELSRSYDWINNAIKDVGEQRYTHTPVTYRLADGYVPLTQAAASWPENAKFRFASPTGSVVEVERIFINAIYTANNPIDINLYTSTGSAVPGITNPIATLPAKATLEEFTEDLSLHKSFIMTAGQDYILEIAVALINTCSFTRLDVTLHFKTDAFEFADLTTLDSYDINFTEADPPDANRILALQTAITNIASTIANNRTGYRPVLVQFKNVVSGGSDTHKKVSLPLARSSINCSLRSGYLWAVFTGTTTANVTLTLKNAGGSTVTTLTATLTSPEYFDRSPEWTGNINLVGSSGANNPAEDYSLSIDTSGFTLNRGYALLWFK